ncbi:MAG TPA: M28 family peptidase [Gemmatimonadales bacterium]|nr:M28 family peptidase [Gemmatimonadales bacterium]
MTGPRPLLALLGAVAALAACAGEPTSPSAARAESITAATILARIAALADDSMLGRATPSPQLDGAALYAARALAAFGLEPAFGAGYLQTWSERGFTSPNAAAVLPGADAQLRAEVVVFVAHLDHIGTATSGQGCAADGADSICNGADDDASGSAAVLELARAYAGLAPRPRRSMLFLLVSGEERGLLGSTWYVANPAVPIARTVAAVALDMISRNAPDSVRLRAVAVTALDTLGLAVAASHPELRLRPVIEYGGGSDHVPFAEAGVPSVALFTGLHADYHRASDAVDRVDADKAARVARLAFYLGLELANRAGS